MKIIIAPDSFKGSLSASEAAIAIEEGVRQALPDAYCVRTPMSDGGEGLLDCIRAQQPVELHTALVTNPVGKKIQACFGTLKDKTAIIEMAKASGLELISLTERDPLKTTSYGTGELIRCALDKGCRKFIIGLGGSATCDGGIGALAALGVRFKDIADNEIPHTGEGLKYLVKIDPSKLDSRLTQSQFIIAHDVDNALLGALLYTRQKGATLQQIKLLELALNNYASLLKRFTQKSIINLPGGGAAGGLAASLYTFLNAKLESGASVVMNNIALFENMKGADLVITGEGQIDLQTTFGKAPMAVAKLAKEFNIPVIAIAARLGKGYHQVYRHGIDAVFSIINTPMNHKKCLSLTKSLVCDTANNAVRLFAVRKRLQ